MENVDTGAAQIFATLFKQGYATLARTTRKGEIRYSAIIDRVTDQQLEEARKMLRSYRADKILLIDKGEPTEEDYNLQKQGTIITVEADLIGTDEEV